MFSRLISILDPNTRRRLRRFGKIKRAKWSLFILLGILLLSLVSEFIAGEKPLIARVEGKTYFPVFKFYPEDAFLKNGVKTRVRYKELNRSPLFKDNKGNWMLWPLVRYGPRESLHPSEIEIDPTLTVTFSTEATVASVDIDKKLTIQRSRNAAGFYGAASESELRRKLFVSDAMEIPAEINAALAARFANQKAPAITKTNANGTTFELNEAKPRKRAPKLVRLAIKKSAAEGKAQKIVIAPDLTFMGDPPPIWEALTETARAEVLKNAKNAMVVQTEDLMLSTGKGRIAVNFDRETVEFPCRSVKHHAFGLDNSGRDVGVRILYGTRIALLFGISLVISTYIIGIFLGAIQGYFAGKIDLIGQRATEIWESMPFLFIMILLSSIYGRSFGLLLGVYALFNWIGISYYMRAEFLKLRKQPFVEAARVMGIGRWKIMFSHILPNALVPIITFFPFSLVGAIFALTMLDYLGFGLPPGTASWGNLLDQGQVQPYAWWLIFYPAAALFIVSLLGIFIGEGVRAAFDPRTDSRLQ